MELSASAVAVASSTALSLGAFIKALDMKPRAGFPVCGAERHRRLPPPAGRGGEEERAGAGLKEAAETSCPVERMVKFLQVT